MEDSSKTTHRVTVIDFDMGFGTMVIFMIKLGFAAIPAALFLSFVIFLTLTIIGVALPNPYF